MALMSLSAVPTLSSESIKRVATNCNAGGRISLRGLAAINRPRSSVQPAIEITAASKEVSFKSTPVAGVFAFTPPETNGCAVENKT